MTTDVGAMRTEVDSPTAGARPALAPVPAGQDRPLWSVMIPTYNCAGYLRETLAGVLAQDPGPAAMQIEVVDDCSTFDDPEAVVAELGQGRVEFFRRPRSGGHIQNFETCLQRSRGRLVHLLHGDDVIRPGFYHSLAAAFTSHPDLGAAFCRHDYIDETGRRLGESPPERSDSGLLDGWLERIAVNQRIQTPAIVVRRDVYETLGTFDRRLRWVEDWEMWTRIAAHYPTWYEVRSLAAYRLHASSNSTRLARTGENVRDVRRAIAIINRYLPRALAHEVALRSREHWARYFLDDLVPRLIASGDRRAAVAQIVETWKWWPSWPVFSMTLKATAMLVRRPTG
jgi:glycosyltransferase involved in cell wall biosynthesis